MRARSLAFPSHLATLVRLLLLVALVATPAAASAFDRLVNADACPPAVKNSTPSYATLQAAVDAADDGDAIGVCPGTYAGTTHVGTPNLSLSSIGHVVLTDGVPCLNVIGTGVRIHGFEFAACDGGIRLVTDQGVIENNLFHDNTRGVIVLGADNIVRNNLVRDNTDAGISVNGPCDGTVVRNNTVRGNASVGIDVAGDGCTITKNAVQKNAVGIAASGAIEGVISFNTVTFNGIGISLTDVEGFLVTRNNVSRNGRDCDWDGNNPNVFKANNCRTETPPGAWD